MRQGGVVVAEFIAKEKERLLRFALARDESESPVADLLPAGEPFVGPGEQYRSGEAALHHAVDVPAEHLGLLVLRMADRVHSEFPKDERTIFGKILETEQVALERVLVVQVNVEAGEVAILRQKEFRWRKAGVGK